MGGIKNSTMCRIGFNTTFLNDDQGFAIEELDPDSIWKDERFPARFEVKILSTKICSKCNI